MRLPATRLPGLGHLYDVLGAAVSGDIVPLQQSFIVKRSETPGGWQLVLTPLHPDSPAMSQIKSLIVTGGRFVDAVEVDKDGGDVDRLSFLDQAIDASPLSPDETSLLSALNK
jgi:Outer membrane lipoprotein carrier protein LolA-like